MQRQLIEEGCKVIRNSRSKRQFRHCRTREVDVSIEVCYDGDDQEISLHVMSNVQQHLKARGGFWARVLESHVI